VNVSYVDVNATAIERISQLREYQASKIVSLVVRPEWAITFQANCMHG
jgi:hypothetical protein